MKSKLFTYPILIKESYLDMYGHVNNAVYMTLFEEARWDIITQNDYGVAKIKETGLGPVVLAANLRFIKELRLRDKIVVESQITSYEGKIGKLLQTMTRDGEICCTAEFTMGLFDTRERKLVAPSSLWLQAVGIEV